MKECLSPNRNAGGNGIKMSTNREVLNNITKKRMASAAAGEKGDIINRRGITITNNSKNPK